MMERMDPSASDTQANQDDEEAVTPVELIGNSERWASFFELLKEIDPSDAEVLEYMTERPLNRIGSRRSLLELEEEERDYTTL